VVFVLSQCIIILLSCERKIVEQKKKLTAQEIVNACAGKKINCADKKNTCAGIFQRLRRDKK
jgi:hypothetical protein